MHLINPANGQVVLSGRITNMTWLCSMNMNMAFWVNSKTIMPQSKSENYKEAVLFDEGDNQYLVVSSQDTYGSKKCSTDSFKCHLDYGI